MRISPAVAGVGSALCLVATLLGAGSTSPAWAARVSTLDLELNEAPGAGVAHDRSGLNHDGAIGSHIRMTGRYAHWDRHLPRAGTYFGAQHLIMVDDAANGSLDPGSGNFSVKIRYRSTAKFGNVIQKGQARTVGGQVKFQQPRGVMSCMFKSPSGQAAIGSKTPLNDGTWHVVRCVRTPSRVTMYVDGKLRNRINHPTGTINNKKPWTIGGKFDCDTSNPNVGADSCDYFPGDIDYVRVTKG